MLDKYFYDSARGLLFLNVVQDSPNAFGPSPLGSCGDPKKKDDPSCPDVENGESYDACPAGGCHHYVVRLNDSTYQPGRSNCEPYAHPEFEQNPPLNQNVFVRLDDPANRAIDTAEAGGKGNKFPHHVAKNPTKDVPTCPVTTP